MSRKYLNGARHPPSPGGLHTRRESHITTIAAQSSSDATKLKKQLERRNSYVSDCRRLFQRLLLVDAFNRARATAGRGGERRRTIAGERSLDSAFPDSTRAMYDGRRAEAATTRVHMHEEITNTAANLSGAVFMASIHTHVPQGIVTASTRLLAILGHSNLSIHRTTHHVTICFL